MNHGYSWLRWTPKSERSDTHTCIWILEENWIKKWHENNCHRKSMITKKTFSGEVSPGGSAPSHQKGHRAAWPEPRGEEAFWDQMWWLGCGYSYRHAVNTACNYMPQHVESAFPNTYSATEASFKMNINYLPSIFPPTSPVWLMLTIKKWRNQQHETPSFHLRCIMIHWNLCWSNFQVSGKPVYCSFLYQLLLNTTYECMLALRN